MKSLRNKMKNKKSVLVFQLERLFNRVWFFIKKTINHTINANKMTLMLTWSKGKIVERATPLNGLKMNGDLVHLRHLMQNEWERAIKLGNMNFEIQAKIIKLAKERCQYSILESFAVAKEIIKFYPHDFEISACPVCASLRTKLVYSSSNKSIQASVYPGGRELPIYSRETLPLIYAECIDCGTSRILVIPTTHWLDPFFSINGQFGQWMESKNYIEEKTQHIKKHYLKAQLEQFKSTEKNSVLEISPGNGLLLKFLRDEYGWKNTIGVEPDSCAVQSANNFYKINLINDYVYRIRNIEGIDLVILDNSLEHHSNPKLTLSIVKDYVRLDGGVFIVVPNYHSLSVEKLGIEYFNLNWGHWHYFTPQSLIKLVESVGLTVKNIYSDNIETHDSENSTVSNEEVFSSKDIYKLKNAGCDEKILRNDFIYLLAEKKTH